MKKLFISMLLVSLMLVGCSSSNVNDGSENVAFSELLDEILIDVMDPKSHGINFFFREPEAFGIKPDLYELDFFSEADFKEEIENSKQLIKEVVKFKDNQLSKQQVLDKKVLLESLNNSVTMAPYYYFEYGGSMIGPQRSVMASFASELEAYTFRVKHDIEAYLNLIKTFPEGVQKNIAFELDRIDKGLGFGQEEIEEILRVYKDVATEMKKEDYFLLTHFDKEMDTLDFITGEEKVAYKALHRELITNNLAAGYQSVIDALSNIKTKGTIGLAHKENGKQYYEILLRQASGRNYSIKQVEKFLEEMEMQSYQLFATLDEASISKYFDMMSKGTVVDFKSGEELLAMIESRYTEDFPKITKPNYELRKVDISMQKSAAPAFYFVPSVDYSSDEKQFIYINGDFDNSLYDTYAHEGIPGHMYQYSYLMEIEDMHPIRRLIGQSSNAEGWATYAEHIASKYILEEGYHAFVGAMDTIQSVVMVKADIGIHYYGWNLQEFSEFMLNYYDLPSEDPALKEMYVQIANTPAVTATYNLSSMYISDLKLMVMQELDERYDEIEFHRAFLNVGSASFNVIEEELKKFIEVQRKQ